MCIAKKPGPASCASGAQAACADISAWAPSANLGICAAHISALSLIPEAAHLVALAQRQGAQAGEAAAQRRDARLTQPRLVVQHQHLGRNDVSTSNG